MGNNISTTEHNRSLQRQREELNREYERKLKEMEINMLRDQLKNYQNSLTQARKENEQNAAEEARRLASLDSEHRRREDALFRRIEEARTESEKKAAENEQKKEKERYEKQQKIIEQYKKQKEEIFEEKIHKITEEFIQNANNFCLKEIKQFDVREIENLVNGFQITESIEDVISEQIKAKVDIFLREKGSSVIKHINIVLVGPTGVGKSTLVNSVLHLNKNCCAKEGDAEPCTMGTPKYYDSPEINFRIADSRGIEKDKNYGVDEVVNDVKNFVEGQLLTKDPDKYVHCLWYCITGSRFEDVEQEALKKLSNIYDDNKLPINVVYTKATFPQLYEPIGEKIKKFDNKLEFFPVVAKDILIENKNKDEDEDEDEEENNTEKVSQNIVKKSGIKKLMDITIEKAKGAVQSSCYTGIKNIIKEEMKKDNESQNKKMGEYIKQESIKKINNFKENMEITEMINSISEIISTMIKYYLYGSLKSLNNDSVKNIEYFLNKFFNQCIKEYKNIFIMFIEDNAQKIAQTIYELQKEINLKNESIMGFIDTEEGLKSHIKKKLIDALQSKAELYCLKNSAMFISEPIRSLFSNLLMITFEKCLKNEKTTKIFEESARSMFNKLQVASKNVGKKKNKKETTIN